MPYIGQRPSKGDENNFKILDDISSYTLTFDGSDSSVVSAANDTITSLTHRFVQGQRVTYNNGGGSNIGGLTSGTVYFIIKEDHNTIKLATTASNASNGVVVNLTGVGGGSSHTLNVAFDGVNTKFKATHTNGQKARITRSAQLVISINGVIQQPHDTATPSTGFGFDLDGTIVFSQAPVASDEYWAHVLTNNNVTFDISDNDIDNFTGNGSTVSFNLSKTPPDNRNVLVTIDGVIQYPNDPDGTVRSYAVVENVLTFVTAPASGVEIQVRHIGFAGSSSGSGSGGVTSFYGRTGAVVLKNTDNIVANNAEFAGNLTVQGTMTTLDTKVTEVDQLEVAANNTTVGVAITQSGTGDILNLYDGSSEVFSITDGGNVRIGDNSSYSAGTGSDDLVIGETTGQHGMTILTGNNSSSISFADSASANAGSITYNHNGTNYMRFRVAGNERVRIQGSNVGIGTDNPSQLLHLQADAAHQILLKRGGASPSEVAFKNSGNYAVISNNTNGIDFQTGATPSSSMHIDQNGKVGIGTDDPSRGLHVADYGDHGAIRIEASGNTKRSGIEFYRETSAGIGKGGAAIWVESDTSNSNGKLRFGTASNAGIQSQNTDMILDHNGKVGINTDSPQTILHITQVADGKTDGFRISRPNGNATYSQFIDSSSRFNIGYSNPNTADPDPQITLKQGGQVGIGTINPLQNLHVLGNVRIDGDSATIASLDVDNSVGLGSTAGNEQLFLNLRGLVSNNSQLRFRNIRLSNGTDWQSSTFRIQRRIDTTDMGYIDFGTGSGVSGRDIQFGSGNGTLYMHLDNTGQVGIGTDEFYDSSTKLEVRGRINTVGSASTGSINTGNGTVVNMGSLTPHKLQLMTNNSTRMTIDNGTGKALLIDSSGKILIGSDTLRNISGSSTNSHIQLEGTTANTSSVALINNQDNTNSPALSFGKTRGASTGAVNTVADGDNLGSIKFCGADGTDIENFTANIKAIVNGTVAGNQIPTDLVFETSPTGSTGRSERLRIKSDGNVGIGTDNPEVPFHVHGKNAKIARFGNVATNEFECITISNQVHGYPAIVNESSGDTLDLRSLGSVQVTLDSNNNDNNTKYFRVSANGVGNTATELFRVHEDGNVGIGTDDPDAPLHIVSDLNNIFQIESTNRYSTMYMFDSIGGTFIQCDSGALRFGVGGGAGVAGGNEKVRIKSSGEVGIGTNNPSNPLHITGADPQIKIQDSANGNHAQIFLDGPNSNLNFDWVSGSDRKINFINSGSGDISVGIGLTDPETDLHVKGDGGYATDKAGMKSNAVLKLQPHASDSTNMLFASVYNGSSMGIQVTNGPATADWNIALNPFGGKVGIGTDNPAGQLHISSGTSGDCELIIESDKDNNNENDNPRIIFRQDGGSNQAAIEQLDNELTISNSVPSNAGIVFKTGSTSGYTNATERLRIHDNGKISVNDPDLANNAVLHLDTTTTVDMHNIANRTDYTFFNDSHHTGSDTIGANRTKAGIRNDVEYSITSGTSSTTGDRVSVYGLHNSLDMSKAAYVSVGGYLYVNNYNDNATDTQTVQGCYGYARGYGTTSGVSHNIYGGYFLGYRGGNVNAGHLYGIYARAQQTTNGSNKGGDITGIYSECEFDEENITNAYAFRGHMDRDAGTITNGYILYGSFSGDDHFTNRWGIHISDSAKNKLGGTLEVTGDITAPNNKSFRIPHPLVGLSTTKDLVHAAIEGPQVDLIYRGKTTLVAGISTVNLDTKSGMTEGTFVALNRDVQCFTTNETGWTNVKGSVIGNQLTIIAQENTCTDTISWMVIGERQDDSIKLAALTDADGKLILEPDQEIDDNIKYQPECEKNIYNEDPNIDPNFEE